MFPVIAACIALFVTLVSAFVPNPARPTSGPEGAGDAQRGTSGEASETAITIAFGGDVSLSRHVNLVAARDGFSAPLRAVPEVRDADLAIVNLESVVAGTGERHPGMEQVVPHYFRGRPETLAVLSEAGIDVVTTANSHSGDYGTSALIEQQGHLAAMGIPGPGSGADRASACAPAYVEVRGIVIAVFSFDTTQGALAASDDTPGICHMSLTDTEAVRAAYEPMLLDARERAHVVLVAPQWGVDFETEPSESKRQAGRLLIDLGADAVLGSHAHVTQGLEVHDGRPILHDAGNLLMHFDQPHEAALFHLTVGVTGIQRIEIVPLVSETGWTRRASEDEAADIEATFASRSLRLGTEVDERQVVLDPPTRPGPTLDAPISDRPPGPPPAPIAEPAAACVVSEVPQDAVIEPIELGPLTLIGARASNAAGPLPGFIRVESYWRSDISPDRDLLLAGRATAVERFGWTWYEEQEPCDWSWPTSRWKPNVIYRDEMMLRPPSALLSATGALVTASGFGSPFAISLGLTDGEQRLAQTPVLLQVSYGIPLWLLAPAVAVGIGSLVLGARWLWRRRRAGLAR